MNIITEQEIDEVLKRLESARENVIKLLKI